MLFALLTLVCSLRFDGHQLWQTQIDQTWKIERFQMLEDKQLIDLWTNLGMGPILYRVSPDMKHLVQRFLKNNYMDYSLVHSDLQELINQEQNDQDIFINQKVLKPTFDKFFTKYQNIERISKYYNSLVAKYPKLATTFSIGKTFEGRPMKGIKISNSTNGKEIFFHGGIHAREWIGPATVTWIASQLLLNFGKDASITKLLNEFTFSIIPVVNVDGYSYAHSKNRYWRKNRQPSNLFCIGTDVNRNFAYGWSKPGASSNPCSDAYYGAGPFSSPEASNIASYINASRPLVYIDFHSFSQLWMYPYGVSCEKEPKNAKQMEQVALVGAKSLERVHGTEFKVGGICKTIYQASGSSVDWAYSAGVKYAFAIELRDKGKYGFMLPAKYIVPSGEETFAGIVSMAEEILRLEQ